MKDNTPIERYLTRYRTFREQLGSTEALNETLLQRINENRTELNNYFMAGLGMGTLYLRLGAVIQLGRKLHDGDPTNDMMFMRQVLDNLREVLPTDTNWRNVWQFCAVDGSEWVKPLEKKKSDDGRSLLERFVTFRNKYAHGDIALEAESLKQLISSVVMLDEMAELSALFSGGTLEHDGEKYLWKTDSQAVPLHPFLQKGEKDGLPYVFQGLYEGKQTAKLLNTFLGNEQSQEPAQHFDGLLEPFVKAVNSSVGEKFDHTSRLDYYNECLIGREKELKELIEWCGQEDGTNVFPVYSLAGMGKGALMAGLVNELKDKSIPTLYHFCGSGQFNNLQAVLYHFIYQTMSVKGGVNLWNYAKDSLVARKLERMPSRYSDVIHLFQKLLSEHLSIPKNASSRNLVIILDGLDDAAVSDSSKSISDWFTIYDAEEKPLGEWTPPSHIKWVFTYRVGQYRFPLRGKHQSSELLQPMPGIEFAACDKAFKPFHPSREFLDVFSDRGAVVSY
jgi:hypothetical protein